VAGFGLANGLSGAHSRAMGITLFKIVDFLIAICVALMIALTLGFVAHYVFGLSSLDIRRSALIGAAIFALLMSQSCRALAECIFGWARSMEPCARPNTEVSPASQATSCST
jgi:hypothetical protein